MSEDTGQQPENLAGNIWEYVKRSGENAAEKVQRHFSVQRLNSRIRGLKRKRRKLLYAIGEKVYELHKKGKVRHSEVLPSCESIDRIIDEIGKLVDEMQAIKAGAAHPDTESDQPRDNGFLTVAEDDEAAEAVAKVNTSGAFAELDEETPEEDTAAGPPADDDEAQTEDNAPADEDADDDLDIDLSDLDEEDEQQ
jgi:hypothetical protein